MATAAQPQIQDSGAPVEGGKRAYALDALRGLAILAMVLSGLIPFGVWDGMTLPPWMYHLQDVLPGRPGVSWVDLVFPFFLFSMGAAMPLAMSRRLEKGASVGWLAWGALQRGLFLAFFACYVAHIRTWFFSNDANNTARAWFIALLGFVVAFPVFARLPDAWSGQIKSLVRAGGWAAAIVLLLLLHGPGPTGASLFRGADRLNAWLNSWDIIILVLANVAFFGAVIWLFTRHNLLLRLAPLGILWAVKLSSGVPGSWANWLWAATPFPWLYRMEFLKYLFLVVPGTIIGDIMLAWMKAPRDGRPATPSPQLTAAGLTGFLFTPLYLAGLYGRWTVGLLVATAALGGLLLWLLRDPKTATERLLHSMSQWGFYLLLLGLAIEPYEGGIKKTPSTLSYYFIPAGLAVMLLIGFTVLIDVYGKRRPVQLLIDNGQNPMLAYIGNNNLIAPLVGLVNAALFYHYHAWTIGTRMEHVANVTHTLWWGVVWGVVQTLALALSVSWFTRRKIFLRT